MPTNGKSNHLQSVTANQCTHPSHGERMAAAAERARAYTEAGRRVPGKMEARNRKAPT